MNIEVDRNSEIFLKRQIRSEINDSILDINSLNQSNSKFSLMDLLTNQKFEKYKSYGYP
mgnify:CR=1 FL=1